MRNDVNQIETRYRKFFSIAIPFIAVLFIINIIYSVVHHDRHDVLKESVIGLGILIFALALRFAGLKIIKAQR
jgi:putative effector of murein hydrolase LrgA (UPF0299 family)